MRTRLLHYFMISCVVLTSVQLTQAQVLNFEPLGVQDGVPANECYKIIQDKKGYIWLFTEFGIVKHNGERFVPVCTNVPFKEQNAYSIHVTEKNEIYFANSFCHIFLIRNDSALLIKPIAEFTKNFTMPDNIINTLIVDTNGDIYFSNFMKSYVYSNSTQRISTLEPDSTDNSRYYNLEYYKKISCHFFPIHHRKLAAPVNVTRLFIKDGPLSIDFNFTSPSLYENRQLQKIGNSYFFISPNTFFKIDAHENMTKINLEGILRYGYDGKKYLWILTTHGIYVFTKELKQVATYLEGYIVSDICFDNQQGIWVTTIGQGLFYCRSNEDFSYINTDIGTQEVIFVRRKENELYVSTAKDECYKIEGEKPVGFHTFKEPVFCQEITPYNGGHFFCAKKGVFYKKNGEIKEFFASPLIFKHIYSKGIFPLGKDSFLSYGGSDMALFTKNKFTKFIHVDHKVLCAIPYKSGLLIGTKEGLYIYDDANQLVKLFTTKLGKTSITSMVHDPHGNLWVGTHGEGLYIITKNNAVIKCKNCPFLVIKSIALTGTEIVVATNLGVYKNDYIGNHILHHWSTVYNTEVNGVEIMGERLWMATRNGLRSINLTKNRKNDHYPILLSSVFSNSKQVDVRKKSLQYNQNDLRFNIDFLDYYSKSKQFYFRLKGPSPLSGKINGNTLQIQNLSPGKYTLEIFPYHGHTFYKDHFARFPFSIQPAFWQTSWFKALAITSTISFSVLIGGLFFRNKRARERKISEVNSLLAEYKLTALKAQINPHFISNSLSAIQLLIDSGNVDKANLYMAKFSLLIRYVLKYSDKSVTSLSDEVKILELNIELEQLRFTNSFTFRKNIAPELNLSEIFVPPLITQPFIENAIWHGLVPLKNEKQPEIILGVATIDQCIVISITDNGIGRDNTKIKDPIGNNSPRESMGTTLTKNRIENLNKLYKTRDAEIDIIDLYDSAGRPAGTCVQIKLPIDLIEHLKKKQHEYSYY